MKTNRRLYSRWMMMSTDVEYVDVGKADDGAIDVDDDDDDGTVTLTVSKNTNEVLRIHTNFKHFVDTHYIKTTL